MKKDHSDDKSHEEIDSDVQNPESSNETSHENEAKQQVEEASQPEESPQEQEVSLEDEVSLKLKEMEKKASHFEEFSKRTMADFENFRRRSQEEKEKLKGTILDSVLLDFLPLVDNMDRALEATQKEGVDLQVIVDGLNGVNQIFQSILEKNKIEKIDSVGQPFDPTLHEALFTQEGDYEEKTVTQEVEKAYKRGDKIIRTAKVAVGVPKEKKES